MNVVRLVADTVRRQTAIFRSASATTFQPLIADPEREPYKYAIQKAAMDTLTPGNTATLEEKLQALTRIGHFCWTGGQEAADFTAQNYMSVFASILSSDEPYVLKLQVLKSLSEVCAGSKTNQELARNHAIIDHTISLMNEGDWEMRKWCLHTLFYLLCDNELSQLEALRSPYFKTCIAEGKSCDWTGWEYNEAEELSVMMNLM